MVFSHRRLERSLREQHVGEAGAARLAHAKHVSRFRPRQRVRMMTRIHQEFNLRAVQPRRVVPHVIRRSRDRQPRLRAAPAPRPDVLPRLLVRFRPHLPVPISVHRAPRALTQVRLRLFILDRDDERALIAVQARRSVFDDDAARAFERVEVSPRPRRSRRRRRGFRSTAHRSRTTRASRRRRSRRARRARAPIERSSRAPRGVAIAPLAASRGGLASRARARRSPARASTLARRGVAAHRARRRGAVWRERSPVGVSSLEDLFN